MDQDLYDEYGNYIGPDLGDEDADDDLGVDAMETHGARGDEWADDDEQEGQQQGEAEPSDSRVLVARTGAYQQQIVLHEDKQHYPSASDVYPDAEILIEEEDTQPLETPIIAPNRVKLFEEVESELPPTTFAFEYLTGLMDHPTLIRNVSILGHLHHGKTALMDLIVQLTHRRAWDPEREYRYTDTRKDEQERGLSIKAVPMSLVMPDLKGKSFLVNLMDAPGHVNFNDEQTAALRLSDGVLLVVDAAEGVMVQTERTIRQAVSENQPIVLVVNKIDRLILELKLPPEDAYHKLQHTIESVNAIIEKCAFGRERLSPERGNVLFASAKYGFCFSLPSFAKKYADYHGGFPADQLAARLWGNRYFNESTRKFQSKADSEATQRSFVQFVLEPVYKIFSHVVSDEPKALAPILHSIGVRMSSTELSIDAAPLLRLVLFRFFGDSAAALTHALVEHVPSPAQAAKTKIETTYTGALNDTAGTAMLACDSRGPLRMQVIKQFPRPDASEFDAFARVFSGTIKVGDYVKVLGEAYSMEDEEDMAIKQVTRIWILEGRYRVEINQVKAGNWALFEGIDASITKTATVVSAMEDDASDLYIFRPLQFATRAVVKVAIEPLNPAELPKMLDGLRKLNKSYPLLSTKVEESGEHLILCTGELYADCVLHDLRRVYSDIEVKVADPVVSFCETVAETSSIWCFAQTPNQRNRLTMLAEPMPDGLAEDIESGNVRISAGPAAVASFFTDKYHWDALAARSVWAFGAQTQGPNVLVDDTLPHQVDKRLLYSIKESIVQGFQWAAREGPLCDEPIRNVKFRLTDATIADQAMLRSGGQIIPTARRVAYSSFLLATPRLMEPILFTEIQAPADAIKAIYNVLQRRRGHVTAEVPMPGTPLFSVHAYLPAIESFGFETDLRTHTLGQAFCLSLFDHWAVVPGDPLDKSIVVRPLEPAPVGSLARDFMVKTRRRKGLTEDVTINKFFDEDMLLELAKQDAGSAEYAM